MATTYQRATRALAISRMASGMSSAAFAVASQWMVLSTTGSPLATAVVGFVMAVPALVTIRFASSLAKIRPLSRVRFAPVLQAATFLPGAAILAYYPGQLGRNGMLVELFFLSSVQGVANVLEASSRDLVLRCVGAEDKGRELIQRDQRWWVSSRLVGFALGGGFALLPPEAVVGLVAIFAAIGSTALFLTDLPDGRLEEVSSSGDPTAAEEEMANPMTAGLVIGFAIILQPLASAYSQMSTALLAEAHPETLARWPAALGVFGLASATGSLLGTYRKRGGEPFRFPLVAGLLCALHPLWVLGQAWFEFLPALFAAVATGWAGGTAGRRLRMTIGTLKGVKEQARTLVLFGAVMNTTSLGVLPFGLVAEAVGVVWATTLFSLCAAEACLGLALIHLFLRWKRRRWPVVGGAK